MITGCDIRIIENNFIEIFSNLKLLTMWECNLESIEYDAF